MNGLIEPIVQYDIPKEDAWLIQSLAKTIHSILCNKDLSQNDQLCALRMLYGLQRLPAATKGFNISICIDNFQISINDEDFSARVFTDDGHEFFKISYFNDSSHCFLGHDLLNGIEKQDALRRFINEIDTSSETKIYFEDNSEGKNVDLPPIKFNAQRDYLLE